MTTLRRQSFHENRVFRTLTPLAAVLLMIVCVSGLFIYPFLSSAASYDSAAGALARQLLTAALAAAAAALIPALAMSYVREDFSISLTLALSWAAAVIASLIAMLALRISPLGEMHGSGVLNLMFSLLLGSVLSVAPALLATGVCILRRIIVNLLASRKR